MKHLFVLSALLLTVSLSAFGQAGDKKSIEEFDKAWGAAVERGDRAYLTSIYADDCMNMTPAGSLNKTQMIDMLMKQFETNKSNPNAPKNTYDNYEINSTPMTATIMHRTATTTMVDGKPHVSYSQAIHFLEKRSGKWQVVSNASHPLSDAEMLYYLEHEWNDADIHGDVAWFERTYADDATDVSSRTGIVQSKAEVIADVKAQKSKLNSAELSGLHARVDGPVGVVTGINHVKGTDDKGVAFDRTVSFTDTFVKRDGRWMVLATQGTAMKTEAEVAKAK